jgi:hypothetical protein
MRKVPQAPWPALQDLMTMKCQASTAGRITHALDAEGATGTQASCECQASTAGSIIHAIDAKGATGTKACFADVLTPWSLKPAQLAASSMRLMRKVSQAPRLACKT